VEGILSRDEVRRKAFDHSTIGEACHDSVQHNAFSR
jgi:hypothetical protein